MRNWQHIKSNITEIISPEYYNLDEKKQLFYMLLLHFFNIKKLDLITNPNLPCEDAQWIVFSKAIEEINKHKPIQYIIGAVDFYGLRIKVTKEVLIPREETEQLVDLITKQNKHTTNLHIMDVCTGSGCIALALKKNLATASVTGIDISHKALLIAKENAKQNQLDVSFYQHDILAKQQILTKNSLDILVSNPPYVLESDAQLMQKNVLNNEPKIALFVPDNNALVFYKNILIQSIHLLKPTGKLYFEIHEQKGQEMFNLVSQYGFDKVQIIKDINGKDRFLYGEKLA